MYALLQLVVPKAAKADIWRLAIVLRYGGIYVDSDSRALRPFREYVWANASVASGTGHFRDLHQWCFSDPLLVARITFLSRTCHFFHGVHPKGEPSGQLQVAGPST